MTKRTYKVSVQASALRTIKVQASSAREAFQIAANRIQYHSGPWRIDFPGPADEHYNVWLNDKRLGPNGYDAGFEDEEDEDES